MDPSFIPWIVFCTLVTFASSNMNDVLVVVPTDESADKRERLIPYIKEQVVKAVDKDAACIHVDWDASYLD